MSKGPMTSEQALARFEALVLKDELGLRFNKEDKDIVWHYTSVAGLSGILGGSSIWASDYRYMNDITEFSFGLDIFEMCLAHGETSSFIQSDFRREILEQMYFVRNDLSYLHVLTASFCLKGNVLSQWRAYARQDGIAVGFSTTYLKEKAVDQKFMMGPVHYYWSDRDKILPENRRFKYWFKQTIERLNVLLEISASENANIAGEEGWLDSTYSKDMLRGTVIRKWIAETVPFIKHPAFEEEQEWRLVKVIQGSLFENSSELKHRPVGSGIVPYIDFNIDVSSGNQRMIKTIVLGPNADRRAIAVSIDFLISKFGLINLSIPRPFHPLRP